MNGALLVYDADADNYIYLEYRQKSWESFEKQDIGTKHSSVGSHQLRIKAWKGAAASGAEASGPAGTFLLTRY